MKTPHLILAAIGALGILVIAFLQFSGDETPRQSDVARLASIELTDYDGNTVSLDEFGEKPLVVNSWAAWCPFCKQELPDFATLQQEFPDIVVIAIDRQEPVDVAKGYTDGLGISETMVYLLDPGDEFYKNIGGFSMPETIFIDENGSIVFHKRGPLTLDEMRSVVREHLTR